ncbi:chorismate synthase [Treponema brennaborense]|uniref:Chorismate synthase n=1 Tax=Treponema brennaborense (strain DSM 12168 / CIP 105900 / DD5/3) TaxID=906968 RepID=F4LJB4_TREBD|nr:chorismate synthase [Treponema brennaborense]AEE17359.1 chorismate synthase [Treponema brennaborense DSM 12168]
MAGSSFGTVFKITTFGESHGAALGAVVDGCPAGIALDESAVQAELDRRRPGKHGGELNAAVTARTEADRCEILSGVFNGTTTGTPIAVLIRNTSQHSKDYDSLKRTFRPGHADYTYEVKYGVRDYRGGGRSSGRETAARVAAGAVAKALLASRLGASFSVTAYTLRAAGVSGETFDSSVIERNSMRAADMDAAQRMAAQVERLRAQGDSCGGVVECRISGVPAGWGEPVFDKLDAELAKAVVSIGAVKGIEFGAGFAAADLTGSRMNDPMRVVSDAGCGRSVPPQFETNNAGGVLGGISSGADIVFRAAVKPVPSIFKTQKTVSAAEAGYENAELLIEGRHDVCLCPRIVPVIEAMTYLTLADMYLRQCAAGER